MTLDEKKLMVEIPHMRCSNKSEFKQRLQWLSEGMLRNHIEGIVNYTVDLKEIDQYQKFKGC